MTLLTIALFIDALINIARIVEIERGMRAQSRMFLEDQARRDKDKREVLDALCASIGNKSKP